MEHPKNKNEVKLATNINDLIKRERHYLYIERKKAG